MDEYIGEPTMETETDVRVLPDGTVVTRKITKTKQKRTVAKSILTKTEDGSVLIRPAQDNSSQAGSQGFQYMEASGSSRSSNVSADQDDNFANVGGVRLDELPSAHTEDLPANTRIERRVTVLQTETTYIEGDGKE